MGSSSTQLSTRGRCGYGRHPPHLRQIAEKPHLNSWPSSRAMWNTPSPPYGSPVPNGLCSLPVPPNIWTPRLVSLRAGTSPGRTAGPLGGCQEGNHRARVPMTRQGSLWQSKGHQCKMGVPIARQQSLWLIKGPHGKEMVPMTRRVSPGQGGGSHGK